jgi:ribosome-associated protein
MIMYHLQLQSIFYNIIYIRTKMTPQQMIQIAVNALENVKGENIVVLDTSKTSSLFSAMVICSGNSSRQISALIEHVEEDFKKNQINIIGIEGKEGGEWVLLDSGDIIMPLKIFGMKN